MTYIIFLLLCLLLFLIFFNDKLIKESFTSKNTIILMGDSIFRNDIYVENGYSVSDQLKKRHDNIYVVAEDNSIIEDIDEQYNKIKGRFTKNDVIFISVGGNDILKEYSLFDVDDERKLNRIFKKYKKMILKLMKKTKPRIILSNIYLPTDKNIAKLHPILKKWNKKQKTFAQKNNLSILELDSLLVKKSHFVYQIEPSKYGSLLISNSIYNSIYSDKY